MTTPIQSWEEEFKKKFPENEVALIWYKAFKEDMDKMGISPTINFEHFQSTGLDIIKDFIRHQIKLAEERGVELGIDRVDILEEQAYEKGVEDGENRGLERAAEIAEKHQCVFDAGSVDYPMSEDNCREEIAETIRREKV